MEQHIRVGQSICHRTAPAFTEISGHRIDGFAAVAVHDGQCFVSLVFQIAGQIPQHHGTVDLVHTGVTHGGISRKQSTFFNAPENTPGDTESQNDHGLGSGEDVTGIILLGSSLKTGHGGDPHQIGTQFACLGFDFSCGDFFRNKHFFQAPWLFSGITVFVIQLYNIPPELHKIKP